MLLPTLDASVSPAGAPVVLPPTLDASVSPAGAPVVLPPTLDASVSPAGAPRFSRPSAHGPHARICVPQRGAGAVNHGEFAGAKAASTSEPWINRRVRKGEGGLDKRAVDQPTSSQGRRRPRQASRGSTDEFARAKAASTSEPWINRRVRRGEGALDKRAVDQPTSSQGRRRPRQASRGSTDDLARSRVPLRDAQRGDRVGSAERISALGVLGSKTS